MQRFHFVAFYRNAETGFLLLCALCALPAGGNQPLEEREPYGKAESSLLSDHTVSDCPVSYTLSHQDRLKPNMFVFLRTPTCLVSSEKSDVLMVFLLVSSRACLLLSPLKV